VHKSTNYIRPGIVTVSEESEQLLGVVVTSILLLIVHLSATGEVAATRNEERRSVIFHMTVLTTCPSHVTWAEADQDSHRESSAYLWASLIG
jgi:hypothetical protein